MEEGDGCAFILVDAWPVGTVPPACGAAALHGLPYCAAHARLCYAQPASRNEARLAAAQEPATREPLSPRLQRLAARLLPELDEEDDAADAIDECGEAAAALQQGEDA